MTTETHGRMGVQSMPRAQGSRSAGKPPIPPNPGLFSGAGHMGNFPQHLGCPGRAHPYPTPRNPPGTLPAVPRRGGTEPRTPRGAGVTPIGPLRSEPQTRRSPPSLLPARRIPRENSHVDNKSARKLMNNGLARGRGQGRGGARALEGLELQTVANFGKLGKHVGISLRARGVPSRRGLPCPCTHLCCSTAKIKSCLGRSAAEP